MITGRSYVTKMATSHLEFLRAQKTLITPEVVRDAVALFSDGPAKHMPGDLTDAVAEEIARDIETQFNVYVSGGGQLTNPIDHVPWLDERRHSIEWKFWDRYRRYMIEDEGRPTEAFDKSVGDVTDRILASLENPLRPGRWERRGLVAGQVQSGKTSNYVGLLNKALDAGYKLVIVMAGAHDSLRSQTQQRINEGVLGFNTAETFSGSGLSSKTGVGLKAGPNLLINCSTTVESSGDFKLTVAKQAHQAIGGDPTVLVVKKNASILRNVYTWATGLQHIIDPETGKKIVPGVPLLVLDDEADYASIDTATKPGESEDETDPSTINGLIRQILDTFEKSAYVAYTATPFANIYIDPNATRTDIGLDLFPEHFIVRLPEPSNYSGPIRFFGLDGDSEAGLETVEPLPTLRPIRDHEPWLRDGHKSDETPDEELPESLKDAIRTFVLACTVKRMRDLRTKHSSMLVHVTRFKDVQVEVARQVQEFVVDLRNAVEYEAPEDAESAVKVLKNLYHTDFIDVTDALLANEDLAGECRQLPPWHEIEGELLRTLLEIEVQVVNGSVKDALMYSQRPNGLKVIAIGGDKLSRGLTLEGLMVSYYLRASRMYDTLMQMGRWFGYRPGYLDLCRIYTTPQLLTWYSRITDAAAKLYREFEVMGQLNRTPRQYGLRIQQHPDGLMVTAANKARHSQKMKVSFAATQCETLLFDTQESVRVQNWTALQELAKDVFGPSMSARGRHVERDVSADRVLNFLRSYSGHRDSGRGLPQPLIEYIEKCLEPRTSELTNWTVMLGDKDASKAVPLGEGEIGLFSRTPFPQEQADGKRSIKRLVSPGDVLLPLDADSPAWEEALQWAVDRYMSGAAKPGTKKPERPTAAAERQVRDKSHGFLMVYPIDPESFGYEQDSTPFVGFAVSFPASNNGLSVDYQVNSVFWDELFDDEVSSAAAK
ncbi:Z1 domain-containing protein [Arthrobacter sp. SAFR-044]|uniref:Z1 domain-containing protein n=1 Tax=Arthrobacter sp. SAFR-044 TaxID=3387278 RepID=UPI003F7C865D